MPGSLRVADAAEAEVDHPRAALDGPADRARLGLRRDGPVVADDLRDEQPRRAERGPRSRGRCRRVAAISPATNVPWPWMSAHEPPTKLAVRDDRGPAAPGATSRRRSRSPRRAPGAAPRATSNASKARSWSRYHCLREQRVVRAEGGCAAAGAASDGADRSRRRRPASRLTAVTTVSELERPDREARARATTRAR